MSSLMIVKKKTYVFSIGYVFYTEKKVISPNFFFVLNTHIFNTESMEITYISKTLDILE